MHKKIINKNVNRGHNKTKKQTKTSQEITKYQFQETSFNSKEHNVNFIIAFLKLFIQPFSELISKYVTQP